MSARRPLLASLLLSTATCVAPNCSEAQERTTQSILIIDGGATQSEVVADESPSQKISLASSSKRAQATNSPANNAVVTTADVVRQRFANGKVHIERMVTQDAEGNFVNHGEYREFNERGELISSGNYSMGKRTGAWFRVVTPAETKTLNSYPFNKFRAPFTSSVEFIDDQMHGVWIITDKDKRIACQIQLHQGVREGSAVLFHSNGQVFSQSEYHNGVLNGMSIEKTAEGKVVREDNFTDGQKLIVDTEHYPNKSIKSVMRYLSDVQQVATKDNWLTTTLATVSGSNEKQMHGEFVTYYDNGQISTKGRYNRGKLDGLYESWYKTGELASSGEYSQGKQVGPWTWRHANGMKRAAATYVDGQVEGKALAWDDAGKLLR